MKSSDTSIITVFQNKSWVTRKKWRSLFSWEGKKKLSQPHESPLVTFWQASYVATQWCLFYFCFLLSFSFISFVSFIYFFLISKYCSFIFFLVTFLQKQFLLVFCKKGCSGMFLKNHRKIFIAGYLFINL